MQFIILLSSRCYGVLGDSPIDRKSSTSRKSYIVVHGHHSPVSCVVVMATRTCQPLLRHRRSSQLAAVACRHYPRTGWEALL